MALRDEITPETFQWLRAARECSPFARDDFSISDITQRINMSESEGEKVVAGLVTANMLKLLHGNRASLTPDGREWIDKLMEEQAALALSN